MNAKQDRNIGFIGVGLMGHGLAKNIAQAGYTLTFLEHPGNQPVDDLYALGARSVPSIADLTGTSDVIVMCVTGSQQVLEIVCGEGGLLTGITRGKTNQVIVDCSTVEPHVTTDVAAKITAAGARFVDAPLTRTPKEAEQGSANVMVGGDVEVLARIRPLLETFAENIYHAGPIGAGATLKLLHNFVSLGNCVLLAEAVISARRSDVDIDTFIEVLASGGGDSTALKRLTPYILTGDAGSFRFSLANSAKDTAYYRKLAQHLGVPATAAEAIERVFSDAQARGWGDRPVPELIELMQGGETDI